MTKQGNRNKGKHIPLKEYIAIENGVIMAVGSSKEEVEKKKTAKAMVHHRNKEELVSGYRKAPSANNSVQSV